MLQVLREVLVSYNWEEDALLRAKSSFKQSYKAQLSSLEGATEDKLIRSLLASNDNNNNNNNGNGGGDVRFQAPTLDEIERVRLEDAKLAVMSQLVPGNIEMSMVGDFGDTKGFGKVMDLVLEYLGSIPEDTNLEHRDAAAAAALSSSSDDSDSAALSNSDVAVAPVQVHVAAKGEYVHLELEDPDPRAVAYVAGKCPNKWGFFLSDDDSNKPKRRSIQDLESIDSGRRSHPFFGAACLLIINEIINRRLFSIVREQRQLTYDANFSLTNFETLQGGWFLVTVTASKANANKALKACLETLESIVARGGVGSDNLSSAKRVVINRHEGGLQSLKGYVEALGGLQMDSIPLKGPKCLTEFHKVVEGVTVKDVQVVLKECFDFGSTTKLFTAIGETVIPDNSPSESESDSDELLLTRSSPVIGMKRGGALRD